MGLLKKFPSFRQLQANALVAAKRFPLALLSALAAVVVAVIMIEYREYESEYGLMRVLLTGILGLPLFVALVCAAERRQWPRLTAYGLQGIGVFLLVGYFFTLPHAPEEVHSCMLRFGLLALGLHLLVACLPYIGGKQVHGFWQYNMSLLSRLLMSAVFSGALYSGLAIALAAADHLFGFDVDGETYFQLWVIMAGIFNTWLFLAGIPRDLEALDQAADYPKLLAVFAQYILLPLVSLYFVILVAYEAKIIIEWNWPKGWVSELVLWYAVVGLLSQLILYPLRKQAERRWVQTFVTWFFRGLLVLLPLLLLAILRRISDYGFTEPRYLVLAMAVGLIIVTLYFLFSKGKDIRVIPVVLGAGAFIAAFGPWSASSVSLSSQMGRLETFLVSNEMLEGDSLLTIKEQPPFENRQEMSSIIRYVCDWHGADPFARWLGRETVDSLADSVRYAMADDVAGAMGIKYVGRYASAESGSRFSVPGSQVWSDKTSFVITGFDYLVNFSLAGGNDFEEAFLLDTDSCFVHLDTTALSLAVWIGPDHSDASSRIEFELAEVLDSLVAAFDGRACPLERRTIIQRGDDSEIRMVIEKISGDEAEDQLRPDLFSGHLLIRRL